MIRAIVFDFYDTLVYRDVAESNRSREAIAALIGVPVDVLNSLWRRDRDLRMRGEIATLEEHLGQMLPELGVEPTPAMVAEAARLEREGQRAAVHYYPDTVAVLARMRALGFGLGLLSNTSDAAQEPLHSLEAAHLFDTMVLSHEVGLLKPDPRIYLLACERLRVTPGECAFVADGGFGELDAAHALGMLAVRIEQDGQSTDYGSSTYHDLRLERIADLLPLAEGWRLAARGGG